jgi:basic membrane lipoprotein Med (substrate-binding protein (PBP1-ABC) superfamily)
MQAAVVTPRVDQGTEIALDLAEKGVDVVMVVRGPAHAVAHDLFSRSTQKIGVFKARKMRVLLVVEGVAGQVR